MQAYGKEDSAFHRNAASGILLGALRKSAAVESGMSDVIFKDSSLPESKMSANISSALAGWRDRRLKQQE